MTAILANWKTTVMGVGLILTALADVITYAGKGTVTPNLETDIQAFLGGIGLIFAGDASASKQKAG